MDDDTIADLKQFIAATVKQETTEIRSDMQSMGHSIRADMQKMEQRLTARIDDLEQSVASALDASNDSIDGQLKDHEKRITLLEQQATA